MNLKTEKQKNSFVQKIQCISGTFLKYKYLYIMLIPFLAWYLLFIIKPLYWLQIAFKDYNMFKGLSESQWVGFKHFIDFFESPYLGRVIKNTLFINLYSLLFCFPAPIILALMLNEVRNTTLKKTIQTITYLPYFISVVVVAGIVTTMLSPNSGVVNVIIKKLGGESIYFLAQPQYFRTIYTVMNLWIGTGYGTVVYISAISSIDQQLYEACAIDGGGKFRQLFHVTIPGMMSTIVVMFIMKVGSLLDVGYEQIILLYQPSTYETADVINSYVYRMGIEEAKYDFSAAVGIFNSVIATTLVIVANKISTKVSEQGLW